MPSPRSIPVLALITSLAATSGCDSLLDVENPGSITDEDIRVAEAAEAWANGALGMVQRSWDEMLTLLSAASDETRFVGAHPWWDAIDRGTLDDPGNTGLTNHYARVASGQWMADEALHVLDSLDMAGQLGDRSLLARTYLYGAIAYATLADGLEDYAPSDRTEPGRPMGPENMLELYDGAVDYATAGLAIEPSGDLGRNLLAIRARAQHARQVRALTFPPPADVSGGGMVQHDGAARDALAALSVDAGDWRYEFAYQLEVIQSSTAFEINCFNNLNFGARYAGLTLDRTKVESVVLIDPLDGVPDPSVERFILAFQAHENAPCDTGVLTVSSAREMHLIVAEDALARGDLDTFARHVNQVRAWESLTPWTAASGVPARDLLIYERQSRLFLTGRRLADMYRFGLASDTWDPSSVAAQAPGTLFPIPQREVEANCHLNGTC